MLFVVFSVLLTTDRYPTQVDGASDPLAQVLVALHILSNDSESGGPLPSAGAWLCVGLISQMGTPVCVCICVCRGVSQYIGFLVHASVAVRSPIECFYRASSYTAVDHFVFRCLYAGAALLPLAETVFAAFQASIPLQFPADLLTNEIANEVRIPIAMPSPACPCGDCMLVCFGHCDILGRLVVCVLVHSVCVCVHLPDCLLFAWRRSVSVPSCKSLNTSAVSWGRCDLLLSASSHSLHLLADQIPQRAQPALDHMSVLSAFFLIFVVDAFVFLCTETGTAAAC